MKKISNIVFSLLFFLLLIIPTITAEYKKDVKSELDNAYLPELENITIDNFNTEFSNYIDKRIGFRDKMLTAYQLINDRLFNILEHPTYMYGKDGHVFFKGWSYLKSFQHLDLDEENTKKFVDGISSFQNYLESRGKDFVYFYIPDKETVYPEYYPKGVNVYGDLSRADQIINHLNTNGVRYFYAEDVMTKNKSMPVNNVKYDSGHWNNHGAFVSIQALYEVLREKNPDIEPLKMEEFEQNTIIMESLQTSHFEINEEFVQYTLKESTALNKSADFFKDFIFPLPEQNKGHYVNDSCSGKPKLLVLGDSYLSGYERFFTNHFSEYTFIHRSNVLNQEFFEYYVDRINPDIVIFENPERCDIINLYSEKTLNDY